MNLFETVKNNVSLREAAQAYGLEVNRHGKALCPFHNDRHPSLYVANDHYYCFTCGEHGDVIDFTARLFDLNTIRLCYQIGNSQNEENNLPSVLQGVGICVIPVPCFLLSRSRPAAERSQIWQIKRS